MAITPGIVRKLAKDHDEIFTVHLDGRCVRAKTVLLATGSTDVPPNIENLDVAIAEGCVRYCPVCDGFEAIGKKVAVLGNGKHGVAETLFVRHFSDDLTLLTTNSANLLSADDQSLLSRRQITVLEGTIAHLTFDPAGPGVTAAMSDETEHRFDVLYSALGLHVNSALATDLGADHDTDGQLLVDPHLQTSIGGLYCAGDVAQGLNQITIACGQAAVAATAIHNCLRGSETLP